MTISVRQLAHAVNTCSRIVPLRVVHTNVAGEESWLVSSFGGNSVRHLYPCLYYTSQEAVSAYCETMDIDRENVITQIEEE